MGHFHVSAEHAPAQVKEGDSDSQSPVPACLLPLPPHSCSPLPLPGDSGHQAWGGCALVLPGKAWSQGHAGHLGLPCRMLPRNCQMLLFSATFEDSVWKFAQKVVPDPNIIKLSVRREPSGHHQAVLRPVQQQRREVPGLVISAGPITIAQAMIFCHVSSSSSSRRGGLQGWGAEGGTPLRGPGSFPVTGKKWFVKMEGRISSSILRYIYSLSIESPELQCHV